MNANAHHTSSTFSATWKFLGLVIVMMCLSAVAHSQNTKGDKAPSNRETRFRPPASRKPDTGGARSGPSRRSKNKKRIRSSERSMASNAGRSPASRRRASGSDRPGKPIRPIFSRQPQSRQKAWKGDITGRRIRSRESTGSSRNVYPQYGKYTHNPSSKPHSSQNVVSNRSALSRLKRLQGPEPRQGGAKPRISPRSGSQSFTARKSINVWANFPRPKRKREKATTRDLAGRRLRSKNFETPHGGVIAPTFKPYAGRRSRGGDRPYKGGSGGYRSATRRGENAWTGDVAGRRVRGRNFTSKKSVEGTPILPKRSNSASRGDRPFKGRFRGGHISATKSGESRTGTSPLPPRGPGMGINGLRKYENMKGRRPNRGGGSASGRGWNNQGQPLPPRAPKQGAGVALFQGNIKSSRPQKGGGSVSGKLWNNNQQALPRTFKRGAQVALFQGNLKGHRPDKGGGSVSGKLWNNKGHSLPQLLPKNGGKEGYFQGNLKSHRPEKGGGSVSGKLWNNNEEPLVSKTPLNDDSQGLQIKKKRRAYVRNKNSHEDALLKLKPTEATYQAGNLQVKVKQKEYGKRPHAAEGSMPGIKPTKATVKASEYARSVKRNWDYIHNPSSAKDAQRTREPSKAFARSQAYQGNIKMRKFELFEKNRALHPDTKFIKTNKNNVDGERDMLTNFKLWWARLFKKQETQPEHLKDKGRKPRYDKGEDGMWND